MIRFLGAFIATITMVSAAAAPASQCYGSPGRGSLAQGVRLPIGGDNFSAYSTVAVAAGRTYMHSTSAKIVIDTYARLASALPLARFVYGETGLQSGGPIAPHRTHQNGLSIDFFAPVRDASGKAAVLPTQMQSRFGYDIEFNTKGQYQQYQIDFPALAEHLYQLHGSAKQNGAGIERVIIDTAFLPQLFATPRGPWLKANLPFMMEKPWVRHDEHYHVDFSLPCRRL